MTISHFVSTQAAETSAIVARKKILCKMAKLATYSFQGLFQAHCRFVLCHFPLAFLALDFLWVITNFETIPDAWRFRHLANESISLSCGKNSFW